MAFKPHTAQSLGKYLGQKAHFEDYQKAYAGKIVCIDLLFSNEITLELIGFENEQDQLAKFDGIYRPPYIKSVPPNMVFPILKPRSALTSKLVWKLKLSIEPDCLLDNAFCGNDDDGYPVPLSYESVSILIENGFGAIPNEESPTGYVDFFGHPCVVEK